MRLIVFSKYSKFNADSENTIKKIEKMILVFQIIGPEVVVGNYPFCSENTPIW